MNLFNTDKTLAEPSKSVPIKRSVHERLGNIVRHASLEKTPSTKSSRSVVSLELSDPDTGDLRNLLHRRKTNVQTDQRDDNMHLEVHQKPVRAPSGHKVMIYDDKMFDGDSNIGFSKRAVSNDSRVVSVVTKSRAEERKSTKDRETGPDKRKERTEQRRKMSKEVSELEKGKSYFVGKLVLGVGLHH